MVRFLPLVSSLCAIPTALVGCPARAQETLPLERILAFEVAHEGSSPHGWGGGPPSTIQIDGAVVHSGEWAVKLERDGESPSRFSTLTKVLQADFAGQKIELRGWLRTEGVEDYAGLWMRQDGSAGSIVFGNLEDRAPSGTTEWKRYSIELPLRPKAREIFIGALLSGPGKAWVDDLELLIDGKPADEAPRVERTPTVLDTDHEFDSDSGIVLGELTSGRIEDLVVLGQVWGFLKYHHPRIARGDLHWDYELFRVLPKVLNAKNAEQRNRALFEWGRRLGEPGPCSPCAAPALPTDTHLRPELDWIGDTSRLGAELSGYLNSVHENRFAGEEQFFVGLSPGVGNPAFENELGYRELRQPDAGYRLLALYRLWNIIEYWFPYRDQIGESWEGVLREFIPRLAAAAEREGYQLALIELIARVHDTHANLWGSLDVVPPKGACLAPVNVRFIEGRAVVSDYSHASKGPTSGLEIGDVLTALDGRLIDDLVAEWEPFYAASNRPTRLRDIARNLTRGECSPLELRIERDGEIQERSLERLPQGELDARVGRIHDRPGETFQLLSDEVAYLKLSSIALEDVEGYIEQAAGTRGLVIDIRNYPSAFVVFELGRRLVKEPTAFTRFTAGDIDNPGGFLWGKELSLQPVTPSYEGKVVVLIDEVSQSQAEYTTMAFRAGPNTTVMGSTTAGADGNVSGIPLPGGLRTMISGIGVFYPDKTPTQRVGIIPDVVVTPTIEGIRQGRDEVLESALRLILGGAASDPEIQLLSRHP